MNSQTLLMRLAPSENRVSCPILSFSILVCGSNPGGVCPTTPHFFHSPLGTFTRGEQFSDTMDFSDGMGASPALPPLPANLTPSVAAFSGTLVCLPLCSFRPAFPPFPMSLLWSSVDVPVCVFRSFYTCCFCVGVLVYVPVCSPSLCAQESDNLMDLSTVQACVAILCECILIFMT